MCRWVLYVGDVLHIAEVVTRPEHSLVDQALNMIPYTPGVEHSALYDREQRKHRDHAINADGWGLAWWPLERAGHRTCALINTRLKSTWQKAWIIVPGGTSVMRLVRTSFLTRSTHSA